MPDLKFNSSTFTLNEHESVLECLLRNAQAIPYACKAGTCQACLIKTVDCEATPESQKWLKETLRAQGYTLACQWVPLADVSARLPSIEEFSVEVTIKSLERLNKRVMRVILEVPEKGEMFHYYPGQYLSLINPDGITRSYSIANCYEDEQVIELHIGETKAGVFTHWLFNSAKVGDALHIRGPAGDCFYTHQEQDDYPIVLACTGTGLAPLYGILHEALKHNHQGPISLFQGARTAQHLYYEEALWELEKQFSQFTYYPSVLEYDEKIDKAALLQQGALESVLEAHLPLENIAQTRVYLCGNPDFVHGLRKRIFLKGAKSSNIYCDPFIERNIPKS